MVPELRKKFNQEFKEENYQSFLNELNSYYPNQLDFRVAETPIFVPRYFKEKILSACESIVDIIIQPDYIQQSEKAIPNHLKVPGQDSFPHFIAFDFGVCVNEQNELEPQLIEMQGFPTLFAYEPLLTEVFRKYFHWPDNYSDYLSGLSKDEYLQILKRIVVGDENPENVVLLELFPHKQKTRIDFYCSEKYLDIATVDLNDVIKQGKKLYYIKEGRKIQIKRIYNRLIFDDLFQQPQDIQDKGKFFHEELEVTWVPHPNWFYRISKYSLPFIDHPYVPETRFLDQIKSVPPDLENYVVKPLFSFAGQGVIIDVSKEDIEKISDKENWILQRKVNYAPVIETPNEPAKAEIRMFYFWEPGKPRPIPTNNLARLSKGKMIGVRYNKDKDWVGGSFALFEK